VPRFPLSLLRHRFSSNQSKPGLFMKTSAAIASFLARDKWPEAKGEDFRSKTRLFPLVPSPVPLAWLPSDFATAFMNNPG